MKRILLIEDRETTRVMVEETLRRRGYDVCAAGTVAEGRALLANESVDLLLTDLQLPDGTGLELLARALERDSLLPVIVMSAFGTIQIAVDAMKSGAYDFVTKPFDTNRLVALVGRALERRPLAVDANAARNAEDSGGIVGESAAIREAIRAARKVAPSDATVLVLGESGTGKELFAKAIHQWSGRASGPLISVNCAAIPRELMEAEFFGSEKGSFTGSTARKLGRVELATGGTLFLDEIGELSPELQAKLLRVLQERTFTRVGGMEEIHTDLRVIAATNRDLLEQVRQGGFREDLFYRLNVFPIRVPSLRERADDVLPLARIFAAKAAQRLGRAVTLTSEAEAKLANASWPGNVRQLQNAMERGVILADAGEIGPAELDAFEDVPGAVDSRTLPDGWTLLDVGRDAQRKAESEAILRMLRDTAGNKTEAARRLGVSYKTLWSKLKEYEIS